MSFFLHPVANENQDYALELIKHRAQVVTFSDSGAHVSSSWMLAPDSPAQLLGAREASPHPRGGVRMLTFDTATQWASRTAV